VLNFGGDAWTDHYDKHYKMKYKKSKHNLEFRVPIFLKDNPKYMKPTSLTKASKLSESLANSADRERLLKKDPMFLQLFKEGLVSTIEQ